MENREENCEMIRKILKKRGKRYKKYEVNGEMIVKIQKKGKINSEKTWETWKKASSLVKIFRNMKEMYVEQWKDLENMDGK